jgi:D-alanine-D-alanine ligase
MFTLKNKRVALLKGGPGSERLVSLASAKGVAGALRSLGAEVTEVDVAGTGFALPEGTDLAYIMVHGTYGEDGQIQRDLEALGVPYTGEGAAGSEVAFDKIATKVALIKADVRTAKYEVVCAGNEPTLPLPYVVKAPKEGSSVGVYIVKTPEEIAPALEDCKKYATEFLVEEYVAGRELTVGILGDVALPVVEIRPREGFYDFNNKYPFLSGGKGAADHYCPADLSPEERELVQQTALAATRALRLEVYCRVDFILSQAGEAVVLEINTIPGMTEASILPEAAAASGISYAALCERIAELSLKRFER